MFVYLDSMIDMICGELEDVAISLSGHGGQTAQVNASVSRLRAGEIVPTCIGVIVMEDKEVTIENYNEDWEEAILAIAVELEKVQYMLGETR